MLEDSNVKIHEFTVHLIQVANAMHMLNADLGGWETVEELE